MAGISEAKYLELLQNVVFKVAISILTIASGGLQNSPVGYSGNMAHKALVTAHAVAMFVGFSVGLAMIAVSVPPQPNAAAVPASVARRLMWVSLGLVHVGVAIRTAIALVEA